MNEKLKNKPTLTIQVGRCIEGMNLVIPEHCSREERERLESEYQQFRLRVEEEKIRWISSLQELIPSAFDGDNRIEIEHH